MGVDILEHPLEIYVTISKIAPDTDKPPVMSTGESEIFGKGLKSMRNGTTILTTVRYGTVRYGVTALFREELNILFGMDDRRILMGLVYPVRFDGFLRVQHGYAAAITAVNRKQRSKTAYEY